LRYLIVNADDFGLTPGVNRGIIEAHEDGIVTSASLMVRQDAAAQAAQYSAAKPRLSIGLHFDFGEWQRRDGEWHPRYEVVPTDDELSVHAEALRQLEQFRLLTGRNPTHLDSHQHVHRDAPIRTVLVEIATSLHMPLRHCTGAIQYCGSFFGQCNDGTPYPDPLTVDGLMEILESLPEGITELGCHPGRPDDLLVSDYREERSTEVDVLCHPRIAQAITDLGIRLVSFSEAAALIAPSGGADTRD
jgi:chitin disaccharide deacetylase